MNKVLIFLLMIILLFSSIPFFSGQVSAAHSSIIYQAPITITNTQTTATPNPFQQMIRLNESTYKGHIHYNGSSANFEFSYAINKVIPAWIESNNSGTLTIWLKIYSIPASSSITIYIDFASLTTNLLSSSGTTGIGEAPQLSPTYGEYDDGASVFPVYYNFAGTTLDSRISTISGVTLTQNNGLSIALSTLDVFYILTSSFATSPFVMEAYETYYGVSASVNVNEEWGFAIDSNTSTSRNMGYNVGGTNYMARILNSAGISPQIFYEGATISQGTLNYTSQYTSIDSFTQTPSGLITTFNGTTISAATTALTSGYIGFFIFSQVANSNIVTVHWLRTRTYPPNGVMPSVKFSSVVPTYTVTFTESGLPSGYWYVNITGQPSSGPIPSSQASYSVSLPNGSYSYTVSTGNKEYKPSSYTGSFTVNGTNLNVAIKFTQAYTITFTESGLPSGTMWYVNLSNGQSYSGTGTTITFSEPNGTYSYTIATVNKIYAPSPYSGSFTVNGSNVNIGITFTLVTYTVTFIENGLPSGTTWYVNLSNGQSYSGTGTTITFNEPNGTYSNTIATVNKNYATNQPSGIFTVNGGNVNIAITFSPVTYTVTFIQNGLPSGTSWSITFNGITLSSTNPTITFNEPNGSYSYIISGISGYRANTYSGIINVNGNSVSVSVNWTEIIYSITITEDEIPNGTSWSATLTGTTFNGKYINVTLSSTINTITFNEPNGSYSYFIHMPFGYAGRTKGNITVSGKSVYINVLATSVIVTIAVWVIIIGVIGAAIAVIVRRR